jgi:hypothetical protein
MRREIPGGMSPDRRTRHFGTLSPAVTEYVWEVDWSVSTTQGTLEPKTQRMCMALRHRDMAQHAPACIPESGRAPVRQLGKAGH